MERDLTGIEPVAQERITERSNTLCAFLAMHCASQDGWSAAYLYPENHKALLEHICLLEQRACSDEDEGKLLRRALCQFAEQLNLYPLAEERVWCESWRAKCFDRTQPQARRIDKHVPEAEASQHLPPRAIMRSLRALLKRVDLTNEDPEVRAKAETLFVTELQRSQLCRNRGNAHAVLGLIQRSKAKDKKYTIQKGIRLGLFSRLPAKPTTQRMNTQQAKAKRQRKRPFQPQHPKWQKILGYLRGWCPSVYVMR